MHCEEMRSWKSGWLEQLQFLSPIHFQMFWRKETMQHIFAQHLRPFLCLKLEITLELVHNWQVNSATQLQRTCLVPINWLIISVVYSCLSSLRFEVRCIFVCIIGDAPYLPHHSIKMRTQINYTAVQAVYFGGQISFLFKLKQFNMDRFHNVLTLLSLC